MDILRAVDEPIEEIRENTTFSGGSVKIEFDFSKNPRILVPDYPFSRQKVINGTLEYEGDVLIEGIPPNIKEYEIRYRTQSGIVHISGFEDHSQSYSVLVDTGKAIEKAPLRRISFSRLALWSFVFIGEQQARIEVIDSDKNKYVEFEEIENLSRKEIAHNYDLHAATIYYTRENSKSEIYVKYSDGNLSFSSDISCLDREYVLQLYEKYVIDNQILPDLKNDNNRIIKKP